ncbi:hypothetical protein ASPBRDRAFT_52994 [Aspergillus brasiliensis CBS 101740]|uniref:Uncharacterized protein n=1 Tax=Aspergillus brasiliensis (strain CBS 101740 / IMI 381727 / IBT 21946) TaxID=767769 RepID=A0A1L9UTG2_ASPBC|nr:hypothetical protein ASPBRDRAFT_52994 [Aspergillus brasiliensis CBS 101740]
MLTCFHLVRSNIDGRMLWGSDATANMASTPHTPAKQQVFTDPWLLGLLPFSRSSFGDDTVLFRDPDSERIPITPRNFNPMAFWLTTSVAFAKNNQVNGPGTGWTKKNAGRSLCFPQFPTLMFSLLQLPDNTSRHVPGERKCPWLHPSAIGSLPTMGHQPEPGSLDCLHSHSQGISQHEWPPASGYPYSVLVESAFLAPKLSLSRGLEALP